MEENQHKFRKLERERMKAYREKHPEQRQKERDYINDKRKQLITESDIMYKAIEDMLKATNREEFSKVCINVLDELGYDTGKLFKQINEPT